MKKSRLTLCGIFLLLTALVCFGCAAGTTKLKIAAEPLAKADNIREGNLLVKKFTDQRSETQYIGNKRNGFGMVLGHVGLHDGVSLDDLLTQYFAEALREAGYNAVIENQDSQSGNGNIKFDAVIDGQIIEFWMDLYMAVWHRVGVVVRVHDPDSNQILWEKLIEGSEKRTLWAGATGEYERIVREALTKALDRAVEEFSSESFYQAVRK